jgi:hypothetical protein
MEDHMIADAILGVLVAALFALLLWFFDRSRDGK